MTSSLRQLPGAFPALFEIAACVAGACVGSFLNVVICRVPEGRSIVRPGSHCACGRPIAWRDNIPVLSWILLRGKARCCGRPIGIRHPLVEALTAVLFLACWRLLPPGPALCGWVFVSGLVGATFIDFEHMVIPDALTLGLGVAGVALAFAVPELHGQHGGFFPLDSLRSGAFAIEGLLAGSGLVFWIAMLAGAALRKEAMGLGDVKFVGAIGAFCGWRGAVFSVFGGALAGTLAVAAALLWRKAFGPGGRDSRTETSGPGLDAHIPFGPMLAVAGCLYFLFLRGWVDRWFAELTAFF